MAALVLTPAVAIGVAGCAGGDINDGNPEELYKDAEEDIENDRYLQAQEKLQTLKNRFPYSKYSVLAKLRLADVYFLEESFAEAAANYESFVELHPKNERAAYAQFRTGESYFKDSPENVSRDVTSAKRALSAFQTFLKRFPNDPQTSVARERIIDINRILAEKELYVADFYYKRDFFDSAEGRYSNILKLYPDTPAAKTAGEKLQFIRSNKLESRNRPEILKGLDPIGPIESLQNEPTSTAPAEAGGY